MVKQNVDMGLSLRASLADLCVFDVLQNEPLELVLNSYLFTSVKSDNDFARGDLRRTYRKTELFLCYSSAKISSYLQKM